MTEDFVRVAYLLALQNDLRKIFNIILNFETFESNVKSSLLLAVDKLRCYYSICSFLTAAAQRSSIY